VKLWDFPGLFLCFWQNGRVKELGTFLYTLQLFFLLLLQFFRDFRLVR
jgi:hypothetical protein